MSRANHKVAAQKEVWTRQLAFLLTKVSNVDEMTLLLKVIFSDEELEHLVKRLEVIRLLRDPDYGKYRKIQEMTGASTSVIQRAKKVLPQWSEDWPLVGQSKVD